MMNDNFMQLSAVEPSFKRFRFPLRPVTSTVKERVTSQDFSLAQNNPWLSLHSLHWLCLQDTSSFCWSFFFFSWGLPCSSAHAYQLLVSLFFLIFVAAVHLGCENELLENSAGWLKVEGWLLDLFELPKPQYAGSLGLFYSLKKKKIRKCLFKQIAKQHGSFYF